jgi:plastocyanin
MASTAFGAIPPTQTAAVLVQGFSFQPPEVAIEAGGSVTWTDGTDPDQHTITPREAGTFQGSDPLFTGDTFTVTFEQPGTIEYFCSFHPTMVGTVQVAALSTPVASVPAPAPTASPVASVPPPAGDGGPGPQLVIAATVVGLGLVALGIWLTRRRA